MIHYFERCIVIGTGKFAFRCAEYLNAVYRLDGVYEYGGYPQSMLRKLCKKNNIPYALLANKKECDSLMHDIAESGKKTFIVSASNIYIFPEYVTEKKNIKIINYHPGLLTKHLGRNAEAWAIYEEDEMAGVTWHAVTPEVDKGTVLAEETIELDQTVTSIKLMLRQYQTGFELYKGVINCILKNEEMPDDMISDYGKMHYSYERPNEGVLNMDWDGRKISAFLRCMDYGSLDVMGKPIIIEDAIKYGWDSYEILGKSMEVKNRAPDGNNRIIEKGDTYVILHNIHMTENISGNRS